MTTLFRSLNEEDKSGAVERLIADSTPRDDFFLLIILSVLVAAFGLLMNSPAVIIGSMLIAPLLSPILGIAMGVVMADRALISRSVFTVGKALLFAIPAATLIGFLFSSVAGVSAPLFNEEINARLSLDVMSAVIALVSGFAASYALIKPQLSAALPGVAVSVSLIPPLAVTGIGLAHFRFDVVSQSLVLFLVNAFAIIFASSVVFSLMRLYVKQPVAKQAMKKEDESLRQEKARVAEEIARENNKN